MASGLPRLLKDPRPGDVEAAGVEELLVLAKMSALSYSLQYNEHITSDLENFGYVRQHDYVVQQDDCFQEPNNTKVLDAGASFVPALIVFTKEKPRQAVVAIKGFSGSHNMSTLNELSLADLKEIMMSFVGGQYPTEGIKRIKRMVDKYTEKGYVVMVTGHSLGGYLAELASTHFDLPGAGFCAPGADNSLIHHNHNGKFSNKNFHNINAQHDPIGNYNIWSWHHKQWTIYLKGSFHLPNTLISLLEHVPNIERITNENVLDFVQTRAPTFQYYLPDPTS